MSRIQVLIIIAWLPLLQGCIGTIGTRIDNGAGRFAGAYPFQAVGVDLKLLGCTGASDAGAAGGSYDPIGGAGFFIGLLSIPVDLVADAVMLPVDLVAWPFGWRKGSLDG